MNSTPIIEYIYPSEASFRQPQCSDPILAEGYDLNKLIPLVQDLAFSGKGDANPYTHLRELNHLCNTIHIKGLTDNTIRLKLFPYSLMGEAKQWYYLTRERVKENWETLISKFCERFFPFNKIVRLRRDIVSFKQHKDEPIKDSWDRFYDLITTCPGLGFSEPAFLQHFYVGLSNGDKAFLNASSRGSFLNLSPIKAEIIFDRICGYSTRPFPKELEESSSNQKEPTIAKPKPF